MRHTPNERGYDYFFGILGAAVDHFTKENGAQCYTNETRGNAFFGENCSVINGYDLQENGVPFVDNEHFLGDLLADKAVERIQAHDTSTPMLMHFHHNAPHTPLQPPNFNYELCDGVSTGSDRVYQPNFRQKICGLMSAVDMNLLKVIIALFVKDMLSSTLILYHSDNGGFIEAGSLNTPHRGQKSSYFDGGVRVPAFMYHSKYLSSHKVTDDLFDVTDVLPTLVAYAEIGSELPVLDGMSHWNDLISNVPLQRKTIPLHSTTSRIVHYMGGLIEEINGTRWKYVLNPSAGESIMTYTPYEIEGEMLFDLSADAEEVVNLALSPSGDQLKILNRLREKSLQARLGTYYRPSWAGSWPPRLRLYPSPQGCVLPLDSPLYSTAKCFDKLVFIPPAWKKDPDTVLYADI